MKKIILTLIMGLMLLSTANCLVCVTISHDSTWNDAKLKIGEEAYFSLVIYNSSAEGKYCEPARYGITLTTEEGINIDDIIAYEIDPEIIEIKSGGYARALIKIIPKVEGYYEIKATTTLLPEEGGGTKLVFGASATIKAHFSTTGEEKYNEVPFWKIRKDCPNGIVVKQGEECPSRICEDKSYRYGNDICPEDEEDKPVTGLFALNIGDINLGDDLLLGISALILALGVGGGIIYFGFIKKTKIKEAELYEEEQRYY